MALRKIFTGDAECLKKVAKPVTAFDKGLFTLLDDMADTLRKAEGVGLAAPQVGVLRRVFVIDIGEGITEFVNPKIVSYYGVQGCFEGCLSYPGESGYVERPRFVTVQAQDRHGKLHEYKTSDLFARAVMHENDHLNGLVYLRLVTEPPEGYSEDDE